MLFLRIFSAKIHFLCSYKQTLLELGVHAQKYNNKATKLHMKTTEKKIIHPDGYTHFPFLKGKDMFNAANYRKSEPR